MSTYGECVVSRTHDPASGVTSLRIVQADPVIRISPSVLAMIKTDPVPGVTFDGETLRICATNQTAVYRIREILEPSPGLPRHWDYIGEWPD